MEFKDLPLEVQEIAAQCLADKISYVSGFAEGAVKNEPAKDQARQIKGALWSFTPLRPHLHLNAIAATKVKISKPALTS
ncbi:hypothetical protein ACRZET_004346 [Klebsiella michiganensis]